MIFNCFSFKIAMQKHNEGEWQGFQHFHDHSQVAITQLPQLNQVKQFNYQHPSCQNSCQKVSPSKKQSLSHKVNMKNIKLDRNPIQSESSVIEDAQKKPKVIQKFEEQKKNQQKQQEVKKNDLRKLERIPIIRRDDDYRFAGKAVYKGFVPKTSDNFMRLLKEVDWDSPNQKKRDIRNLHGIEFNSQFQGGNLNLAMEYDLYMRVDTNTQGHRQWFYFSMKNEKKCTVKLHIYRFKKQFSLFQRGMKPYVRSRKTGQEWKQGGQNVYYHYQRSKNQYGVMKPTKNFVLSFTYRFQHPNDQVFIAAGIPYTYTFLNKQISLYKQVIDKRQNLTFDVSVLCKSVCGLELPMITVYHCMSKLIHANSTKKIIVINARSHSGEASCSWVLDGLLKELSTSLQIEQWMLKENIWLKIVPMLNPDGVYMGNYRTGIIGQDFNRHFKVSRYEFYPEIAGLKKLVSRSKKQGEVLLFLDLHGHSILKNSFFYGPTQAEYSGFKMKKLPYYLFHKSKYFRLGSCRFKNQLNRNQTARLYFQNQQKILSFTCENSLGLYYHNQQTLPMLAADWQAFGQSIIHSMKDIFVNKQLGPNFKQFGLQMASNDFKKQEKKMKYNSQKKVASTPKNKIQRVTVKVPMTPLSTEQKQEKQFQCLKPLVPYSSTQINREDDFIDINRSQKQSLNTKVDFRVRRKSQLLKNPINNLKNKISRKQTNMIRANSQQEKSLPITFERSLTTTQAQNLKMQIMKANSLAEQKEENYFCYELEQIPQNFSDEYISMNDSDSSSDDLPQIQKNYILDYIKQNQRQNSQQKASNQRQTRPNNKESKDAKISKFREIRFKSIQQMYIQQNQQRDALKNTAKKIKLEPHKFKDSASKSLVYKYNEIYCNTEFDDPSMVSISQQKRLNERTSNYRRGHKDPFVLIQRKDRKISLEEPEYQ